MSWRARAARQAKRLWPHVVAAFVVFHVAAQCVDSIPDVSLAMNKRAWSEPRVRDELQRWAGVLGVSRADLEGELWILGTMVMDARKTVGAPFRPYLRATAQRQAWAMFVAGSRTQERFRVVARACAVDDAGCDWQLLYARGDDAHTFMQDTLEHARIRSAAFRWGWPQMQKSYERGCRAIAARVFAARPELVVVQCRFVRTQAPGKDGVVDGKERDGPRETVNRADVVDVIEAVR